MKTDGSDQNTKGQSGTGQPQPPNGGAEDRARKTLQNQITGMAREFERALPGKIGVERMMRIVMTAILKTPQLAQCDPQSFFGALAGAPIGAGGQYSAGTGIPYPAQEKTERAVCRMGV